MIFHMQWNLNSWNNVPAGIPCTPDKAFYFSTISKESLYSGINRRLSNLKNCFFSEKSGILSCGKSDKNVASTQFKMSFKNLSFGVSGYIKYIGRSVFLPQDGSATPLLSRNLLILK